MGRTIIIFVAILAAVNAGYVWQDDDDKNSPFKQFPKMTFPNFPTFPSFPFPHINFPTFPTIPPMVFPTPEDIAKQKGKNYNGISVSTSSSSTTDKDGKVIQTGGTTIVTNKDGVVKEFTFGDKPESIIPQPVIIPKMPIFQPIFPLPIPIMTPGSLKTFKPGKNENFIGSSSSSYIESTDVNGVKTAKGGTSLLSNVNGDVNEKSIQFGENEV